MLKSVPIGTVRVRRHSSGRPFRVIKFRHLTNGGAKNWMKYARYLWLVNRGEIPRGRIVIHLDGDSMNDDLSNIALGYPGDRLAIGAEKPGFEQRRAGAVRKYWKDVRRARSAAGNWIVERWYGVDFKRRAIWIEPNRTQFDVYAAQGVETRGQGRSQILAAALGWPGLNLPCAVLMRALVDSCGGREVFIRETVEPSNVIREYIGWSRCRRRNLHRATSALRELGYVSIKCFGQAGGRIQPTAYGLSKAGKPCRFIAVLGKRLLADERFKAFDRVHDDGQPVCKQRGRTDDGLIALANLLQREDAA